MWHTVVYDQSSRVCFHCEGFAQRIFGAGRTKRKNRDLAAGLFAQLQSRFQGVLAKNIRYEICGTPHGLSLFLIDLEITRGNFRIENLLQTNNNIHSLPIYNLADSLNNNKIKS